MNIDPIAAHVITVTETAGAKLDTSLYAAEVWYAVVLGNVNRMQRVIVMWVRHRQALAKEVERMKRLRL